MLKKIYRHKLEIGIVLAMAGIQFSVIIRSLLGVSWNFTNLFFLLSLVLIFDYNNVFVNGRLHKIDIPNGINLGYNVYVTLLALFAGASLSASVTGVIYTLYTIFFIIALWTNNRNIDGKFIVDFTWASTGIFSVFLFYLVTDGLTKFNWSFVYLSSGADRLTLSVMAYYHLCVMILYHPKNKLMSLFKIIFALFAFYDGIICSRRGLMVAFIIIVLYHLWQNTNSGNIIKTFLMAILAFTGAVLLIWVLMKSNLGLGNLLSGYFKRLILGIKTYFGNTSSGTDIAAVSRNNAFKTFISDFSGGTIIQKLFGHGYAYWWKDIPYLEAFMDMGIFGGVWYLLIQLFLPIKCLLRRSNDLAMRYAQYFAIIAITYNLYSGLPYGQYKFVGTVLLFYVSRYMYKKQNNMLSEHYDTCNLLTAKEI